MPTLDWIGKRAVVNHHREVPYRLLKCDRDKSFGDPEAGNLLVQGDNLEALKALLPYYAGKVKCIYIDPPYNTGNESWIYNDNVNSPEMRAWLGKVVGKEAEDLSRHDKWLCMMYPRLRLLKEFLREDGVIFVSIDDIEYARLKLMLDEIFGVQQFMASFAWKSRKFRDSRSLSNVSNDHEYILAYSGSIGVRLAGEARDETKFSNRDGDSRGSWMSRSILGLANRVQRPNLHYAITDPANGNVFEPPPDKGWRYSRNRMDALIGEGLILFPSLATGRPREKKFREDLRNQTIGLSSVIDDMHTADGSLEIRDIFGSQVFDFPKPSSLIEKLFEQVADDQCIFMDSFIGSGSSAHAALKISAKRKKCRFIGIEIDDAIAQQVTRPRLKRAIEGYASLRKNVWVEGLGGGFRYCTLGAPLFDPDGDINAAVSFRDLAAHVFFCETGSPIRKQASPASSLIGTFRGRAIHLLYARDSAGVPSARAGNVLNLAALGRLPEEGARERVVYGEGCTVPPARLAKAGVTFKQIPYQIGGL